MSGAEPEGGRERAILGEPLPALSPPDTGPDVLLPAVAVTAERSGPAREGPGRGGRRWRRGGQGRAAFVPLLGASGPFASSTDLFPVSVSSCGLYNIRDISRGYELGGEKRLCVGGLSLAEVQIKYPLPKYRAPGAHSLVCSVWKVLFWSGVTSGCIPPGEFGVIFVEDQALLVE